MSYLKGIDISNNNGNLNLSSLKGKIDVVYMKATEGGTFKDAYMEGYYKQCKSNGFKTGAYHFLVATSTPEAQAINFYNKIKNYTWDCYPMLDVETITGFTSATLCNYVTRFITKWKSLSSLPLGIYSYTSFIPYLNSIQNTIKNMPFWEANYNGKPFVLQNTFFTNRIGHQYSEKGIVENFKGDVNVFTDKVLINSTGGKWLKGTSEGNENKWWYRHSDGTYTKSDWEKIDNKWYFFDYQGWMCTGWIYWQGKDYYCYSNGEMAHDTILYGYKFDSNGVATKL